MLWYRSRSRASWVRRKAVQTSSRVTVGFVVANIVRPSLRVYYCLLYQQGLKTGILFLDYCRSHRLKRPPLTRRLIAMPHPSHATAPASHATSLPVAREPLRTVHSHDAG